MECFFYQKGNFINKKTCRSIINFNLVVLILALNMKCLAMFAMDSTLII